VGGQDGRRPQLAETGGGPISVIVRRMDKVRDEFTAELFDMMKTEIQGLYYDIRMMD
jgi:hypothetical protein